MKIRKINIKDYGPLRNFTVTLDTFDVIFGLNESGKTAIVEVLSYVLFKRISSGLRYGKPENISIEIEENERHYTLPAKKLEIELPSLDIANLLYVQASESSVFGSKEEGRFWDGIKAMLSKIGEGVIFTKLDSKIFDTIGLTPKRVDWKEDKQRLIHNEEERKNELEKYLKGIDKAEKEKLELSHLLEKNLSLKKELKRIENYKNYKNYKELMDLYNAYREKKIHLQEYERYKYDYLTKWQELETKKTARASDEKKLTEVKEETEHLEKEIAELKKKEEIIEIEDFQSCIANVREEVKEPKMIYPLLILLAATIVFILSFIIPSIPVLPSSAIFIIGLVLLIFFMYKRRVVRKTLIRKNEWLTKAKKLFPDISSVSDLADKIKTMHEMKIKKEISLGEKRKFKTHLSSKETIVKIDKEIAMLRNKTGLAELSDLKEKIDKKREFDTELSKISGKISGMLFEKDDRKWERMIKSRKTTRPDKEPDLIQETDVEDEIKNKQERIDELKTKIKVHEDSLREKFNITDERTAFIEYGQLQRRLKEYDLEKRAALQAREILRSMSSELDEFIHDILRGEESLSKYFKLVTNRYDEVEVKNKDFVAKEKSGKEFKIENLSSGAQDQLLFCFRIAALKKIYPRGSFLILDDAFIFADWDRRKKLGRLLKKFTDDGNQVLYLTSDDHTRDLFKELGARITTI